MLFITLQIVTAFLVAVAMSLALAHALEWPGKRRLDRDAYRTVQTIYYPGFTLGGFSEWLGIVAVTVLLWTTPVGSLGFRWTLVAFVCLIVMHGVYWVVTHPVNRFWLQDADLTALGSRFFGVDPSTARPAPSDEIWRRLRDRWERSHLARAVLASVALIALLVALAR